MVLIQTSASGVGHNLLCIVPDCESISPENVPSDIEPVHMWCSAGIYRVFK